MLKNSQTTPSPLMEEEAVGLGIEALQYLAGDPELLERFLAISGLEAHRLREEASRPAFFAGLLDFFLDHEPTLDAFAAQSGHSPETVVAARAVLERAFGAVPR
jgi:hypothetical protein